MYDAGGVRRAHVGLPKASLLEGFEVGKYVHVPICICHASLWMAPFYALRVFYGGAIEGHSGG